ncbi:MAG: tetraacyldisaccharide 4'-kinase [Longimicrobiales bacterium]
MKSTGPHAAETRPAGASFEQSGQHALARIWRAADTHPAVLLLRPMSALFGALVRTRRALYERGWRQPQRVKIPVISVGNLTVGGTGKTPLTRWLVEGLLARHQRPAVLHGGYADDEPALHRIWHPDVKVYVGRERSASAHIAVAQGATVLVLDDGRQHLRLARDLDIVLVAAETWTQPRRLLPAGAWREPLGTLRSAGLIVVTRKAASAEQAQAVLHELTAYTEQNVAVIAWLALSGWTQLGTLEARPVPAEAFVVCGIAEPGALVEQLEVAGTRVSGLLAFADHHEFSRNDLERAQRQAAGRTIVITEKDAVKIARLDPTFRALVAKQQVVIERGQHELWAAVERVLA